MGGSVAKEYSFYLEKPANDIEILDVLPRCGPQTTWYWKQVPLCSSAIFPVLPETSGIVLEKNACQKWRGSQMRLRDHQAARDV